MEEEERAGVAEVVVEGSVETEEVVSELHQAATAEV